MYQRIRPDGCAAGQLGRVLDFSGGEDHCGGLVLELWACVEKHGQLGVGYPSYSYYLHVFRWMREVASEVERTMRHLD